MKNKIKIVSLIGLSAIIGISSSILPFAIVKENDFNIEQKREKQRNNQINV